VRAVILDVRYEKVREGGVIRSQAVLVAIGINWEGQRQVLAVELATASLPQAGRTSPLGLKQRGFAGVEFVVSDDHAGLKRAIGEVLPEAAWQRCYVHFRRNALDYLPRKADDDCLQELRWLYHQRDIAEATGFVSLAFPLGSKISQAHRLGGREHRGNPDLLPIAPNSS
jgi:putative transposase